jgi:hypothetical protein
MPERRAQYTPDGWLPDESEEELSNLILHCRPQLKETLKDLRKWLEVQLALDAGIDHDITGIHVLTLEEIAVDQLKESAARLFDPELEIKSLQEDNADAGG